MKAPDKIYIAVYPNDDGLDTHLGDWYSEPEFHAEDNLEYINKDALIEWVNKKLQDTADALDFRGNQAFMEMYSKLNSM